MNPCHLLLVEDNKGDVRLIKEALRESGMQIHVRVASNGQEALELMGYGRETKADYHPDLILLDLNLPRLSGREVLSILKRDLSCRRIPVLIFSSSQNEEDIKLCYQSRANCYISKPTGFEDYIEVIHKILDFWFDAASLPGPAGSLQPLS